MCNRNMAQEGNSHLGSGRVTVGCVTEALPRRPIEPLATSWQFPSLNFGERGHDLIAAGADLKPGTLLSAYRSGYFPMPLNEPGGIGWWSPDPRGVIEPDQLRVSRSLRRSARRYEIRINSSFTEVIEGCADPSRPQGWINDEFVAAYTTLHQLGWAHSVEAWDGHGLAGGLYGVGFGNFFAGESMFYRRTDASKIALVALIRLLGTNPSALVDVQRVTPHLESLGATELDRPTYVRRLELATRLSGPAWSSLR